MRLVILSLAGVLILAACARSNSAAGKPSEKTAATPTPTPSAACVTESPVDSTYDQQKDAVHGADAWLRHGDNLTLVTIAPIQLSPARQSIAEIVLDVALDSGRTVSRGTEPRQNSSICSLTIQYSDKDFDAVLNSRHSGWYSYPRLILPASTLRAKRFSDEETSATTPSSQLPNGACPAEPAVTKSHYRFAVKPSVKLLYSNGRVSSSVITEISCVGYNQKGASLVNALGRKSVGLIEL